LNGAADSFLNEVRGEVDFVTEVVTALVGNDEFDGCGTSDLYISDVYLKFLKYLEAEQS
jgi:hypothetical protein